MATDYESQVCRVRSGGPDPQLACRPQDSSAHARQRCQLSEASDNEDMHKNVGFCICGGRSCNNTWQPGCKFHCMKADIIKEEAPGRVQDDDAICRGQVQAEAADLRCPWSRAFSLMILDAITLRGIADLSCT